MARPGRIEQSGTARSSRQLGDSKRHHNRMRFSVQTGAARYLSAVRGKKISSNMIVSPHRWKCDLADSFPLGDYVDRQPSPPFTPNDRAAQCTEVLTSWRNNIAGSHVWALRVSLFSMNRLRDDYVIGWALYLRGCRLAAAPKSAALGHEQSCAESRSSDRVRLISVMSADFFAAGAQRGLSSQVRVLGRP